MEMAVAVAIVGALFLMVFVGFQKGLGASKSAQCVNNLHQIGVALRLYMGENSGAYPPNRQNLDYHTSSTPDGVWEHDFLKAYLGESPFKTAGGGTDVTWREAGPFWCPADAPRKEKNAALSYGSNYYRGLGSASITQRFQSEKYPSKTIYMTDIIRNDPPGPGTAYIRLGYTYPFGSISDPKAKWAVDFRHHGRANLLFLDGHIQSYSASELAGRSPELIQ